MTHGRPHNIMNYIDYKQLTCVWFVFHRLGSCLLVLLALCLYWSINDPPPPPLQTICWCRLVWLENQRFEALPYGLINGDWLDLFHVSVYQEKYEWLAS